MDQTQEHHVVFNFDAFCFTFRVSPSGSTLDTMLFCLTGIALCRGDKVDCERDGLDG